MSLTQDAYSVWVQGCMDVVAPTVLLFDYTLTLSQEIRLMWIHPTSRTSLVFFLNRYVPIASCIVSIIFSFSEFGSSESTCKSFYVARQASIIFSQAVVAVLLALRIVALYQRDKRIIAVLVGAFVLLIPLACWSITGGSSYVLQAAAGCHIASDFASGVHISFAWIVQAIWDILIFSLTIRNTLQVQQSWRSRTFLTGTSLVNLVWRDGAFYFAIMAVSTLVNIGFFYVQQDGLRGVLAPVASSISVSMMSRLFLNLAEAVSSQGTAESTPDHRQTITILFASHLDSTGQNSVEHRRH
ncbi:unnamed protein product [Peniophora sp. CBMAI 1063]|nr:unnamed protein product [Peniophora sp. CBMAI 1063]